MDAVFKNATQANHPKVPAGAQGKLMGGIQVRQKAAANLEKKSPELRACPVNIVIGHEPSTSIVDFIATGEEPDYTQNFLNAFMESSVAVLQELGLAETDIRITDFASSPESTKPKLTKTLTIGGFAGMIVGLEIVFLIALFDGRVMSSAELVERFSETILGQLPHSVLLPGDWINVPSADTHKGRTLNAYRRLRSTLHFMAFEGLRPKAFLVTSAASGEGKSSVAANLAIALAAAGSRTLLVDADLQNGVLHNHFSLKAEPGVSEIARGVAQWQNCVVPTNVPNLTFLPRGRTDVKMSDYFVSNSSDRFLREIFLSDYERIVFDSSPIFAGADTVSLAPKIDATLLVIREEVSLKKGVRQALDALRKRQVNVIGLIYTA